MSSSGSSDIHYWTDTQGRNIQAKFVKADQNSLTINWNGKVTTLPLSMFSDASRKLAAKLQSEQTPAPVATPSQAAPKIDLQGDLSLAQEYPWQNTAGRVANGLFISLGKTELKISMNGGTREVAIPVDSLNKDSLALAKKLQVLASAEQKGLAALIKKRKAMKVPAVTEADLEIEHDFTNTMAK